VIQAAAMGKSLTVRAVLFLSLLFSPGVPVMAKQYTVNVYKDGYSPNYLQIARGDSVYWVNQDYFAHTITSVNNLWTPGYLSKGLATFRLAFNGAGTYQYYDQFSRFAGTIVVSGPPPNDRCSSAVAMSPGTVYTVNTDGATSIGDPDPPPCSTISKGVWYSFTPATSGRITISTCDSDFDTVLAVYTGSCGSLSAVAGGCDDDNGPACPSYRASVTFFGAKGTTYRIFAGGFGDASGNLRIVATNSGPPAWPESTVPFDIGASIARTDTNLIHVVDSTNDRLLTLDTANGKFVSSIRLESKLAYAGLMCFSLDGQLLYVPLANSNRIQVISLATLTTQDIVPLNISPRCLAAGYDGALYATTENLLAKINPTTGQTLGSTLYYPYYLGSLIKANGSGTRLYLMPLGLSGGSAMIDEYAVVPSGFPTYVTNHFNVKANDIDFVIAEDIGWLYSTSGGVYGIGAWNMATRTYYFWPYDAPYGVAVAMIPNDSFVYGAAADYYAPRIRRFDRLTGAVSATYDIAAEGYGVGWVSDRSLKVTPNGRIFYARETRKIGLIGSLNLTTNIPVTAEVVDAGTNRIVPAGDILTLKATAPVPLAEDNFTWSKIAGPGQVKFSAPHSLTTTVRLSTPGDYILEIMRSKSTWRSRDRLYVTATGPQPLLDQVGFNASGRFQMRLVSGPGTFEIQSSSNLVNWEIISNVVNPTGEAFISDVYTNRTQRFYRARVVSR
jgi:plastocyanin